MPFLCQFGDAKFVAICALVKVRPRSVLSVKLRKTVLRDLYERKSQIPNKKLGWQGEFGIYYFEF